MTAALVAPMWIIAVTVELADERGALKGVETGTPAGPPNPSASRPGSRRPGPPGFHARLSGMSLLDLLQMLHLARQDVTLVVRGERVGRIHLAGGELVHAEWGDQVGAAALRQLLLMRGGLIDTAPAEFPEPSLRGSFEALMLDLLREIDEERNRLQHLDPDEIVANLGPSVDEHPGAPSREPAPTGVDAGLPALGDVAPASASASSPASSSPATTSWASVGAASGGDDDEEEAGPSLRAPSILPPPSPRAVPEERSPFAHSPEAAQAEPDAGGGADPQASPALPEWSGLLSSAAIVDPRGRLKAHFGGFGEVIAEGARVTAALAGAVAPRMGLGRELTRGEVRVSGLTIPVLSRGELLCAFLPCPGVAPTDAEAAALRLLDALPLPAGAPVPARPALPRVGDEAA